MSLKLLNNEDKEKLLPESLTEGDIVPIILEKDDGTYVLECEAFLIEPMESRFHPEPFPFIEYSETRVVNATKEKWKVMICSDSPFDNGIKLIRWVYRFHSTGTVSVKEIVEPIIEDEDDDLNPFI